MRHKTFVLESKEIDAKQGIFEAMISTESVDRDDDIMLADGAVLNNYMRNPIVLFGHNYREARAVVGRALEVEIISGQGLRARWQFAGLDVSPDADLVRRLWAGGFLNATSIGFNPKQWEPRETDDGEKLASGRKYTEWELLEFSIVPVPANQDALRLAMKSLLKEKSPPCRQEGETVDECVERKIPEIREENPDMDDEQVIAIAYSMCDELCGDGKTQADTGEEPLSKPEMDDCDEPNDDEPKHDASDALSEIMADTILEFLEAIGDEFNG